jgi:two-component system, LytTR family, sensor kinase
MRKKVAPTDWLTIADEGERLRRFTRILFAIVWIVPGLVATLQLTLIGEPNGQRYGFGTALLWQGGVWALWAVWSQLILTLVDKVKLGAGQMGRWVLTHTVTCLAVCVANVLAIAWMDRTFAEGHDHESYTQVLTFAAASNFDFEVVLYWAVVGAAYMVEYLRRYRERDKLAVQLEQKLAHMQLDALRMQLNPHFLFNALNSVSALMDMDVSKAQSMLTRVSDLLRLSLRSAGSPTVPVWQEIELVELYLQVAQVRYGDGLDVDIDVDPHVVDAQVPSFIMQPLVENALKHGLQPGRSQQKIHVVARQAGDAIELLVEDNGRGLDGLITNSGRFLAARPSVDGLGIGLTNTRSRLTMLYGDRYAFRMSNTANGGCRVEIRLPME